MYNIWLVGFSFQELTIKFRNKGPGHRPFHRFLVVLSTPNRERPNKSLDILWLLFCGRYFACYSEYQIYINNYVRLVRHVSAGVGLVYRTMIDVG